MDQATMDQDAATAPAASIPAPIPACADPAAGLPAPELAMMWLSSPALPVGGFSYSEGLEAAVDAGVVPDEAGALRWLRGQLQLVLARSELPAAARAHAAWRAGDLRSLREVQSWVLATRESAELRLQSQQMGRSMLDWLARLLPGHALLDRAAQLGTAPCWPLGFALGACALGLDARRTLQALGFSWLDNQVQAALRSVPLGQSSGQRLLHALSQDLPAAVERALELRDRPESWQSFSPMLAVLSARHETQYSRLFRS
ncbi:MAG: urease accessory protein UreF [Betaproteobacteria bacterium]|nr:urease accessory protein UreF [Betaproteobacteria bacterium]MBU6510888.1 urease accessory protein UreF [Betaproteobacteria bacterium]MDE1954113.1 urease accessory protein UreF [Betaproteobacteria bacterium]MDE2151223.1 urease accessory protein UreF [Betaproteobacteria bacterium]MDE2477844.1 urease accessory protein UreF [Betaproteobacteria bacterium]